ncbi:uncharacterized protein EHS24_004692 [Apiotrichum porosum]|uniref:Uncharacterized protein n=1 Tax=Apiotrichum porosum TaxID=105984 RepID=A0A427Y5R1_9TREE|nr:uncharacterized protein EHS24_004692 [Apiotrichum porosum]RSH86437.1 hypothetical protein EHS24_004692 [Apiotrichum porosum]
MALIAPAPQRLASTVSPVEVMEMQAVYASRSSRILNIGSSFRSFYTARTSSASAYCTLPSSPPTTTATPTDSSIPPVKATRAHWPLPPLPTRSATPYIYNSPTGTLTESRPRALFITNPDSRASTPVATRETVTQFGVREGRLPRRYSNERLSRF